MNTPEILLNQTNIILKAKELLKQNYDPLIAPNFSPVSLFHPNENDLSRVLADLLNPSGTHAQGTLFLDTFIRELNLNPESIKQSSNDNSRNEAADIPRITEDACVWTEYSIKGVGRLDILIKDATAKSLIAIENKPWASDGNNQLKKYSTELSDQTKQYSSAESGAWKWLIVYLCDTDPSKYSIAESDPDRAHIVRMSFSQLADLLSESAKNARVPSVRYFVENFARYLLNDVSGKADMDDTNIRSLAQKYINATKELYYVYPKILENAWATFFKTLKEESKTRWGDEIEVYTQSQVSKRCCHVGFRNAKGTKKWSIAFEADQANFHKLFWGAYIFKPEELKEDHCLKENLYNSFNDSFNVPASSANYWAWWRWGSESTNANDTVEYFPETFENEYWLSLMLEGKDNYLTKLVLDKVEKIYPVFKKLP